MVLVLSFLVFFLSLAALFFSANFVVRFSVRLSQALHLSPLIIGATIVAIGTSLPELAVTVSALMQKSGEISLGNIVGSNIANVGLVLSISAFIRPVKVGRFKTQRSSALLLMATFWFVLLQLLPFEIRKPLSVTLLFLAVLFVLLEVVWGKDGSLKEDFLALLPQRDSHFNALDWLAFAISLIALIVSSRFLVTSSLSLASYMALSSEVIGLTLVAVGTSLPELSVSIFSALKREDKLLLGNIVGSNIINITLLGAVAAMSANVSSAVHTISLYFLLVFTVLTFIYLRFSSGKVLGKGLGALLIIIYVIYLYLVYYSSPGQL